MSDFMVKIIPTSADCRVSDDKAGEVLQYLNSKIAADCVEYRTSETPSFVDCGSNLEKIVCPICGAEISFDWWGQAMQAASAGCFNDLTVRLPCCGVIGSLNDLKYHFPCGFACAEVDILNPACEPDGECLRRVEEILGVPVRVIHCLLYTSPSPRDS